MFHNLITKNKHYLSVVRLILLVTQLRRVSDLMRKSMGRVSGQQAQPREESRHRVKTTETRTVREETDSDVIDGWGGAAKFHP